MEDYRDISIEEIAQILRAKILANSTVIFENVKSIDQIKEEHQPSKARDQMLKTIFIRNRKLEEENFLLREMSRKLINFHNTSDLREESERRRINSNMAHQEELERKEYRRQYLEMTISGEIKIDENHPFVSDQDFMKELFDKCQARELYEYCDQIKQFIE